jgi:hypothetical protein
MRARGARFRIKRHGVAAHGGEVQDTGRGLTERWQTRAAEGAGR